MDKDAGLSPNWGGQLAVIKILAQHTLHQGGDGGQCGPPYSSTLDEH